MDGLDGERIGLDRTPVAADSEDAINSRTVNSTAVPAPTPAWAAIVHPELEPDAALVLLWVQVLHVCRMDAPDPAEAVKAPELSV